MNLTILRPDLAYFSALMERRLQQNDWKMGWKKDSVGEMFEKLTEEFLEVHETVVTGGGPWLISECIDLANICMMLADVAAIQGHVTPEAVDKLLEADS